MTPRIRQAAAAYRKLGTAAAVARELGVSRQQATRLLHVARDAGLMAYDARPKIAKTAARRALRDAGTIVGAALALEISAPTFAKRFPEIVDAWKDERARKAGDDDERRARREYMAARRVAAHRDGICSTCFVERARPRFTTCAKCAGADKMRLRVRSKNPRKGDFRVCRPFQQVRQTLGSKKRRTGSRDLGPTRIVQEEEDDVRLARHLFERAR